MTAPARATAPRSDGTKFLRRAGTLVIWSGIAGIAQVVLLHVALSMKAPPDVYIYGPGILVALIGGVFGLAAGVTYFIAFVMIFAWNPGTGRQLLLFAPALGALVHLGEYALPDIAVILALEVLVSAITILAAVYVYQQRIFLRVPSLVFLVTLILAQAPAVVQAINPSVFDVRNDIAQYIALGLLIPCGIVMRSGARQRAMLIRDGLLWH